MSDIYTYYKMFRREQFHGLDGESNGVQFDAEFLAKLLKHYLVVCEAPIAYHEPSYTEGKKANWNLIASVAWQLIKSRLVLR